MTIGGANPDQQTQCPCQCPCKSGRRYDRCCEPYLNGQKAAPTAEALMRSRYTAFCAGNADYLMATHHPAHRSPRDRQSLAQTIRTTQWLNLRILATQKGQRKDKQGTVEFVAAYCEGRTAAGLTLADSELAASELADSELADSRLAASNRVRQLHERSQFVKENGQWFYTEGEVRSPFIPKRDQPCWCGSGQKFKQCHEKI